MNQGERIRYLRKEVLKITLDQFGEKIGLKKSALSHIETGKNTLTEQVAKSICREFNVDYIWLTEGKGDMFVQFPGGLIDIIAEENNLDKYDIAIIETYLEATKEEKETIKRFLKKLNDKTSSIKEKNSE